MPEAPRPRWRLDAVALILFAAGTALAACVVAYRPLTGIDNPLGPAGDDLAGWLVDALGVGAVVLLVGWFALAALYAARRHWSRLLVRAVAGWYSPPAPRSRPITSPRRCRHPRPVRQRRLGRRVPAVRAGRPPQATAARVVLAFAAILGLVLAADGLVRGFVRTTARDSDPRPVGRVRQHPRRPRRRSAHRRAGTRRQAVPASQTTEVIPLAPATDPPITRHTELADAADEPEPEDDFDADAEPIPIHRPTALTQTPLPFRVVPDPDEPAPPEDYDLPSLSLLADPDPFPVADHEQMLRDRAALLEKTFADFGLMVRVVGIHTGPVVTQYEVALDTGLRLNKVTTLSDDLALNLGVPAVRIVAPLPGRNTVGIEVPNDHRQTVRLKELVLATTAKAAKSSCRSSSARTSRAGRWSTTWRACRTC